MMQDERWLLDLTAADYPSPALLQRGVAGARYRRLSLSLSHDPDPALAALDPGAVLLCAQGPERALARGLFADAQLLDPSEVSAATTALPAYDLAPGPCHAEVDMGPSSAPLHPLVLPAPAPVPWLARLDAMVAGLAPSPGRETVLYLNDPAVPLDMDRLRGAAELVRRCLKERETLPQLHLRAWPAAILADERLVPHLSLLPLASLDLLAGQGTEEALARLGAGGLGHLCSVSLVLGLPGEDVEHCVAAIQTCLRLCVEAGVRRIRLSLFLDAPRAPESPQEQARWFCESHPDWHPLEHRGLFDFVALMQAAVPSLSLIGPGYLPGWEPEEEVLRADG